MMQPTNALPPTRPNAPSTQLRLAEGYDVDITNTLGYHTRADLTSPTHMGYKWHNQTTKPPTFISQTWGRRLLPKIFVGSRPPHTKWLWDAYSNDYTQLTIYSTYLYTIESHNWSFPLLFFPADWPPVSAKSLRKALRHQGIVGQMWHLPRAVSHGVLIHW